MLARSCACCLVTVSTRYASTTNSLHRRASRSMFASPSWRSLLSYSTTTPCRSHNRLPLRTIVPSGRVNESGLFSTSAGSPKPPRWRGADSSNATFDSMGEREPLSTKLDAMRAFAAPGTAPATCAYARNKGFALAVNRERAAYLIAEQHQIDKREFSRKLYKTKLWAARQHMIGHAKERVLWVCASRPSLFRIVQRPYHADTRPVRTVGTNQLRRPAASCSTDAHPASLARPTQNPLRHPTALFWTDMVLKNHLIAA